MHWQASVTGGEQLFSTAASQASPSRTGACPLLCTRPPPTPFPLLPLPGRQVFHHTRRRFLRQLLLDLCPALEACGATYWVDFGSLLGIHR